MTTKQDLIDAQLEAARIIKQRCMGLHQTVVRVARIAAEHRTGVQLAAAALLLPLAAAQPVHAGATLDAVRAGQDVRCRVTVDAAVAGHDHVIHLAGLLGTEKLYEDAANAIDVNVKGVINGVYAALPLLKATPGARIVNTASTAGIVGAPQLAVYSASKWAVRGLGDILSLELGAHGVRVLTAFPPDTDTPQLAEERPRRPAITAPVRAHVVMTPAATGDGRTEPARGPRTRRRRTESPTSGQVARADGITGGARGLRPPSPCVLRRDRAA
jgi:NAD(P)-dependent dehydrogenase (short-subunit alcohol dehydrogenase family)